MSDSITPLKKCSRCEKEFPATTEYFHRHSQKECGLNPACKACIKMSSQAYYLENKDRINKRNSAYSKARPEIGRMRTRRYIQRHPETREKYYLLNRDRILEYGRNNRQAANQRNRAYKKRYPEKVRIHSHIRRTRQLNLPCDFTDKDWFICLDYWHNTCAVCGGQLRDLFGEVEPHADHWIPLSYKGSDNPGTVPENMICLCNGCNFSKNDAMPTDWLEKHYSKFKAREILKRVESYFEWARNKNISS